MSGGDAPFLAPSGSLSIGDGEGWGEAASLLVRPKNLPVSIDSGPVRSPGFWHLRLALPQRMG